uniref:Peptidase S1 domain-containing protein n=1 Tax=Strigamia maritima TaxID=126957 RepID=T1ISX7_STRMM
MFHIKKKLGQLIKVYSFFFLFRMAAGLQALLLAMMLSDAVRGQEGGWKFPNSRSLNITDTSKDLTSVNSTDVSGRNSINIIINTPPESFHPGRNPSISINGHPKNPIILPLKPSFQPFKPVTSFGNNFNRPAFGDQNPSSGFGHQNPSSGFGHQNPSSGFGHQKPSGFGQQFPSGFGHQSRPGFNQFSHFTSSSNFNPNSNFGGHGNRFPTSHRPSVPNPSFGSGMGGFNPRPPNPIVNGGSGRDPGFGGFNPNVPQRPPAFVPPPFGQECSCTAFYLCKASDVVFGGPNLLDQRSANKDVVASGTNDTVTVDENGETKNDTTEEINAEVDLLDTNSTLFRSKRADDDDMIANNDTDVEVNGRSGFSPFQPFPPPPGPNTIPDDHQPGRPITHTPGCPPLQVCCRSSILPPRPGPQPLPPPQAKCGTRNLNGIVGRVKNPNQVEGETQFGEYPWQGAILRKDGTERLYVCGATLISPTHVLTAAHCVHTHLPVNLKVRLGEWDVSTNAELYPFVEIDVADIRIHPEFYPGNLNNDIAVLRLAFPVDFRAFPHVAPVCLPPRFESFAGQRCVVTGWGKDSFGLEGIYQNILKQVDLPVIANFDCENRLRHTRLGPGFFLHPGFMCAGGEPGKDACKGDGGSPLVCELNGAFVVAGLVSWGIGCGHPNVPGVYVGKMKIAHFSLWVVIVCCTVFMVTAQGEDEEFTEFETCPCETGGNVGQLCKCVPYYLCNNNSIVTDGGGLLDFRAITRPPIDPVTESPIDDKRGECGLWSVCCSSPIVGPLTPPKPEPQLHDHKCGIRHVNGVTTRVLNVHLRNDEAQFGEYPWQAAILRKEGSINVFVCGGSLIGDRVVITAAHCIKNSQPQTLKIRLGEYDTQSTQEVFPHTDVDVTEIIIHKQFNPHNAYNDIAILILANDVTFAEHIDTICLPDIGEEFTGKKCQVTGWGKNAFDLTGEYQRLLKSVTLPEVPHGLCEAQLQRTRLGSFFELNQNFMCAGGEEGVDACKGDGGGPLVCEHNGVYKLAGVVAWGIGCGQKEVPGVYVKVANYLKWLDDEAGSRKLRLY